MFGTVYYVSFVHNDQLSKVYTAPPAPGLGPSGNLMIHTEVCFVYGYTPRPEILYSKPFMRMILVLGLPWPATKRRSIDHIRV